jgi:hypothetical protein
VRIFVTKVFARFARAQRIGDDRLREAAERAEKGLVDAALGGGLIKQRVARTGQGRSGGFRVVIVLRHGDRGVALRLCQEQARQISIGVIWSVCGSWVRSTS